MFLKKSGFYKRNIAILAAACSILSGCAADKSGKSKPDTPITDTPTAEDATTPEDSYIPKETVTLNLYSDLSSFQGIQQGWFAEVMEDKFNVRLNIIMADNDTTDNRYKGAYDLIISGSCQSEAFQEAMNQGYFLDWNDYDTGKYAPYISKNLTSSYISYPADTSEHIYGLYTGTSLPSDHTDPIYSWELRYDYYEELGKPEIATLEDWVTVLAQMKENHPVNDAGEEVYGISYHNEWDDGMLFGVQDFVCAYYGYEAGGLGFYDWENRKYYGTLAMETDGSYGPYLRMLKLSNELYRKGLLNPDSETQDYNNAITKLVADGRVLASFAAYSGSSINEKLYPVIPTEAKLLAYELGHISNRGISIDSETKYPELCMAILDYFYSPEGMMTMQYGPKGECWDYDADGLTFLTDFGSTCLFERSTPRGPLYFADGMPMFNISPYNLMSKNPETGEPYAFQYWTNAPAEPAGNSSTASAAPLNDELKRSWCEWSASASVEQYMNTLEPHYIAPNVSIIHFSKTELSGQYEAVSDIIISQSWKAIKASDDETFNQIVQEMTAAAIQAGYNECVTYEETHYQSLQK